MGQMCHTDAIPNLDWLVLSGNRLSNLAVCILPYISCILLDRACVGIARFTCNVMLVWPLAQLLASKHNMSKAKFAEGSFDLMFEWRELV
jgi:hypothetical protein